MILDLGWVDISLLAILALSMIAGLMRGLTFELLSLVGWVVAYFVAQWFAPVLLPHIPIGIPGSDLRHGIAFGLTFLLALIIWGLGVRLISMLIKSSPLSGLDRLLGAVFGFLRGMVLLLVIVTVVAYTPWARSPQWRASGGVAWVHSLLDGIAPMLPPEIAPRLPASGSKNV